MKFYFEGEFVPENEPGRLAKVAITPPTQNRQCREIRVLVAKELPAVASGDRVSLGMVGKEKTTPMIFPARPGDGDKRILAMGRIPQPKHRHDGRVWEEQTTARMLDISNGGGAWGSGSCFLAILEPGQRVVSTWLEVWENVDGKLSKHSFASRAEFDLYFGLGDEPEFV